MDNAKLQTAIARFESWQRAMTAANRDRETLAPVYRGPAKEGPPACPDCAGTGFPTYPPIIVNDTVPETCQSCDGFGTM